MNKRSGEPPQSQPSTKRVLLRGHGGIEAKAQPSFVGRMDPPAKKGPPPPLADPNDVFDKMLSSFGDDSQLTLDLVEISLSGDELDGQTDIDEWDDINDLKSRLGSSVEPEKDSKLIRCGLKPNKTYGGDRSIKLVDDYAESDEDVEPETAITSSSVIDLKNGALQGQTDDDIDYWRSQLSRVEGQVELALAHLEEGKDVKQIVPDLSELIVSESDESIRWLAAANLSWLGDPEVVSKAVAAQLCQLLANPLDPDSVKVLKFYRTHLTKVVSSVTKTDVITKFG